MNDGLRWNSSAEIYAQVAPLVSFYRDTCDKLVEHLAQRDDAVLVDLGCGSAGILTSAILKKFSNCKKVYAIDASEEMIDVAKQRFKDRKIEYINGLAEDVGLLIKEKVDVIFCNSAFWLFDQVNTLRSAKTIIKHDGFFVCNYPEWDVGIGGISDKPKLNALNNLLTKMNIPIKVGRSEAEKLTIEDIDVVFRLGGFIIDRREIFEITVTPDDWKNFYRIPAILHRTHGSLPVELAMKIYQDAHGAMLIKDCLPVKWLLVLARPAHQLAIDM